MLLVVRSCILLDIDFFFFLKGTIHLSSLPLCVWCWVNSGSTLSSQAPLSSIPPHRPPSCLLHTGSWYLHNMNSGTSCLCLYYYYYSVMTYYTADRNHVCLGTHCIAVEVTELLGWTGQRACGSWPSSLLPVSSAAFTFLLFVLQSWSRGNKETFC